ncbi:MAG: 50S ribosomal protein L35 [Patescibacteria group bacterium]
MPKIKTRKAVTKRFRVTKNKKVIKRTAGQDHFNARESGQTKRQKRRDGSLAEVDARNVRKMLPYS